MKPKLTDITGIGPSTAQDLAHGGIRTVDDLANASASAICAVPGFGAIRAARIKAAAAELIRRSGIPAVATEKSTGASLESVLTTEELPAGEVDEPEKSDKEADKKSKKTKKAKKTKKEKGKSKKDKKGKSGGKKGKKKPGK